MIGGIKLVTERLLDILFPKECLGCAQEGEYVCGVCRHTLAPLYPEQCFGCHKPTRGSKLCDDCGPKYAFDGMIIASDYETELVGALIKTCKYRFVKEIANEIAELAIKKLEQRLVSGKGDTVFDKEFFSAVIIPVPLSKRRLKWRGFNQAELIAKRIGEYFSLPVSSELKRIKHRSPQAKLDEAERLNNLHGCFSYQGQAPKLVLLVDDVVTTGTTINECARVLREAGAEEIWGVACAKG